MLIYLDSSCKPCGVGRDTPTSCLVSTCFLCVYSQQDQSRRRPSLLHYRLNYLLHLPKIHFQILKLVKRRFVRRAHKRSKNLEATSIFYASERHEASSTMRTQNYCVTYGALIWRSLLGASALIISARKGKKLQLITLKSVTVQTQSLGTCALLF